MKAKLDFFYRIARWTTFLGMLAFVFDFGFATTEPGQQGLDLFYYLVVLVGVLATVVRYITRVNRPKGTVLIFDVMSVLFTLILIYVLVVDRGGLAEQLKLDHPYWLNLVVVLAFIREFSEIQIKYDRTLLNPAQLFIVSFVLIILLGTLLLKLPNATYNGISFIDALFTSTSAVCVTGLAVVDTGTFFTQSGLGIIMFLIQCGGLGILTFASYFSYFFRGGTSYENQLVLNDLTNAKTLGEVLVTVRYVLLITFSIEIISAVSIYLSLDNEDFSSHLAQMFFAAFHAVSAFCNAGFSTLSSSLYQAEFKFDYGLQLVIIATFFLGGLGFPIVTNIIGYLKYLWLRISPLSEKMAVRPWVLNLDSRMTLFTTASISVIAIVLFFLFEYNNTLAEHRGIGKAITAVFGATTPRTAGFNSIDTGEMLFPTTLLVMLLMWIGASPQSTGGGIKTSTFAIATLNILSLARGKDRIEVFGREIAEVSVRRAFAIIALSLIVISTGIICISLFDQDKDLLHIAFECFSAYSTVGLSLGITSDLSEASKLVIIVIMFIGRVTMLTLIIAIFKKVKQKNYRYPTEEVLIN